MSVSTAIMGNRFSSASFGLKLRASLLAGTTLVASASASIAQVPLNTYADAKGYINVRTLTCGQLVGTFQEDANYLGVWYSGWFNGQAKLHAINIERTQEGLHRVIQFCKVNPDMKVTEAIGVVLKGGK